MTPEGPTTPEGPMISEGPLTPEGPYPTEMGMGDRYDDYDFRRQVNAPDVDSNEYDMYDYDEPESPETGYGQQMNRSSTQAIARPNLPPPPVAQYRPIAAEGLPPVPVGMGFGEQFTYSPHTPAGTPPLVFSPHSPAGLPPPNYSPHSPDVPPPPPSEPRYSAEGTGPDYYTGGGTEDSLLRPSSLTRKEDETEDSEKVENNSEVKGVKLN